MTSFDAKKAFDSVYHIGFLHKCMRDGLPGIFIRFLRSWLKNRTMRIRIGETLSRSIRLLSGVPQGSVLAPEVWNLNTGDIPTTISSHSDNAVYADDTSTVSSHRNIDTLMELAQKEIWQLEEWTKKKRIKFEPSKTNVLAIHPNPKIRRQMKETTLYLDRNKLEPLHYTEHAKLLGVKFSETGTFHQHITEKLRTCYGRIKQLYRFNNDVNVDTLYKVYRTSIEPIILYATEVLYENFSCNTIKKLNALEFTAIKTAYRLDRQTPTIDCLKYLKNEGIAGRLTKRRDNFVENNKNSTIVRHAETLKHSQGRRIRTRNVLRDRSTKKEGWKASLKLHKKHLFFSDLGDNLEAEEDNKTIITAQEKLACQEGHTANSPTRFPNQRINHVRFRIRPERERRTLFDPGGPDPSQGQTSDDENYIPFPS